MYKQAIIVRRDLEWTKGKIAAHAAHAAVSAANLADEVIVQRWQQEGAKKVVLRVNSMEDLKEIFSKAKRLRLPCVMIHDAGKTQLKKGTTTALGIGPAEEEELDRITGSLKLL